MLPLQWLHGHKLLVAALELSLSFPDFAVFWVFFFKICPSSLFNDAGCRPLLRSAMTIGKQSISGVDLFFFLTSFACIYLRSSDARDTSPHPTRALQGWQALRSDSRFSPHCYIGISVRRYSMASYYTVMCSANFTEYCTLSHLKLPKDRVRKSQVAWKVIRLLKLSSFASGRSAPVFKLILLSKLT